MAYRNNHHIVVAPQGFKGTLSGSQVAKAMTEGIRRVLPRVEIVQCPVADGGDGTVSALSINGKVSRATVVGPMGSLVRARWGVMADGSTAVIELAEASGLAGIADGRLDLMGATTYGTGQLVRKALDGGYRHFIIGMGGSATHDGGMGAIRALGVRSLGENHHEVRLGARGLAGLRHMDFSKLDPRIRDARFQIATDVYSPLCGPLGAAAVFARQKGAKTEELPFLEAGSANLADVIRRCLGLAVLNLAGSGAAGGAAAGLLAVLGKDKEGQATLTGGASLVCDKLELDDKLRNATLVVTGEGQMDAQTVAGKAPFEVILRAKAQGVTVAAVVGRLGHGFEQVYDSGIDIIETTSRLGEPPPTTYEKAYRTLVAGTARAIRRAEARGLVRSESS